MIRQRLDTTWPFVVILVCLFLLSVTSPRLWERAGRKPVALNTKPSSESTPRTTPTPPSSTTVPPPLSEATEASPVASVANPARTHDLTTPAKSRPVPSESDVREKPTDVAEFEMITPAMTADEASTEPTSPTEESASPALATTPEPRAESQVAPLQPGSNTQVAETDQPASPTPVEQPKTQQLVETAEKQPEPAAASPWPEPVSLLEQLDELAGECETGVWALDVHRTLRKLPAAMTEDVKRAAELLSRLVDLRLEANRLANRVAEPTLGSSLRRAGYSLERRLDVWRPVTAAGGLAAAVEEPVHGDPKRLGLAIDRAEALTRATPEGRAWAKFLALDKLREIADGRDGKEAESGCMVARAVLDRMDCVPLNPQQRRFLAQEPWAALRTELRAWAVQPVSPADLLKHVEQYESTASPANGCVLAEDCQRFLLSPSAVRQQIGRNLALHYRNANVRLVVTEEMLNRMISAREPEFQYVDDVVMGNRVTGQSRTDTEVRFSLVPDPQQLHLALEVGGQVSASTRSSSGPARFINASRGEYRAWKEITVGPEGMTLQPAEVEVANDVRLRGVATDFDGIPLIGAIAQEVARNQHQSRRSEMNTRTEEKISARAKQQIDAETNARLNGMAQQIEERMIEPLAGLLLGPTVISAETTDRRAVLRMRLASDGQLGGNTPRPMAPGDSLATVQVHESALNNIVEQLGLDGRTFTLPELRQRLADRLKQPEIAKGEGEHDDITITFARENAARVRCQDGTIAIVVSVATLTKGAQAWENFEVRAFYRPQINGRIAELVREDVIQLIGQRLTTRSQIALRGVFSKAFSKDRPMPLLPDRIAKDQRIAGLGVTQLEIEDGWLALALGPERAAQPLTAQRHADVAN